MIDKIKLEMKKHFTRVTSTEIEKYINDKIYKTKKIFQDIDGEVRDYNYVEGLMDKEYASALYRIIKSEKPSIVVETGVCNGLSTSVILKALNENGEGKLYSIDLPETPEMNEEEFSEKKDGAVIPVDKEAGWLVPDDFRDKWEFIEGNTLYKLPELLEELQEIDIFVHDSEHSYEVMMFEFCLAYRHLNKGGMILVDDKEMSLAYRDFSKQVECIEEDKNGLGVLRK